MKPLMPFPKLRGAISPDHLWTAQGPAQTCGFPHRITMRSHAEMSAAILRHVDRLLLPHSFYVAGHLSDAQCVYTDEVLSSARFQHEMSVESMNWLTDPMGLFIDVSRRD